MFETEGEGKQIFQLSKILISELATTVISFSGAQDGPRKAVQWLTMKFNSPHLLLHNVYQEIKDITSPGLKLRSPGLQNAYFAKSNPSAP